MTQNNCFRNCLSQGHGGIKATIIMRQQHLQVSLEAPPNSPSLQPEEYN